MSEQLTPQPLKLDLQPLQQLKYSNDIQLREKSQAPNSTIEYFAVAGDTKIIVVGYDTTENTKVSTATRPPTIIAGETDQKEATGDKPKNTPKALENKKFDCYIIKDNTNICTTSFEVTNYNTGRVLTHGFIDNLFYMYYGNKILFIDFIEQTYEEKVFDADIDGIEEQRSDTKPQKQKGFNIFLKNDSVLIPDEKFINFTKKPYNVIRMGQDNFCQICKNKKYCKFCNTGKVAGDYYAYIDNENGQRVLKYGNINDLMQEVTTPGGGAKPVEGAKPVKDPKPVKPGANGFMPLYDQYVLF